MGEEVVREVGKYTVGVERSVQVRPFETLKASIFIPADVAPGADGREIDSAIREAFFIAKAHLFEQLGLQFEDKDGVLVEMVTGKFEGSVVVDNAAASAPAGPPQRQQAPGTPDECPACGGTDFWDNRPSKASGKYKANSPDFKCKADGCGKGIWLTKKGSK